MVVTMMVGGRGVEGGGLEMVTRWQPWWCWLAWRQRRWLSGLDRDGSDGDDVDPWWSRVVVVSRGGRKRWPDLAGSGREAPEIIYGEEFEESVRNCFVPSEYEDPNGALSKLLQLGTVKDYQREFDKLMNRATDIPDSLLISFYIFGLKLHLQREFLVSRPTTLGDAFSLALITEARLDDQAALVAGTMTKTFGNNGGDKSESSGLVTPMENKKAIESGDTSILNSLFGHGSTHSLQLLGTLGTDMGLLDFIKTADPRKVQAVEVQKGDDQEGVAKENAYLELADPDEGTAMVRQSEEEVVTERPKKVKKKRPTTQSDVLPTKKLRTDHPSFAFDTRGKTLASLEQIMPTGSRLLAREQSATPSVAPPQESASFVDLSAQASLQIRTTMGSFSTLSVPVDIVATTTTSTKAKLAADVNPDLAGPSQLEESEGSDDSFYELATFDLFEAKRWYVPRWNITNDSLLDDGFSCRTLVDRVAPHAFFASLHSMDCDQLYTEFNVGAARQICLGSEVRSRTEHKLELKEKLNAKYAARGKSLEEKDLEILRLKSQLAEKEVEAAEVIRLCDQVSSLSREKSTLTAEVSALKVTITQKDNDISLLDSRATHLASSLDDAKVACAEAGTKNTLLASERDRPASEISRRKWKFSQELYNRVAELETHVIDVSGRLEGEFYPTYLTLLARRRWLLTHEIQLALLKCLKSLEYQGILGHALGRAIDFGMQEGLEASHEHGVAGRSLFMVDACNPEVASADYVNAVMALKDAHFPLVDLLKSKKDAGIDEVLDCFLLDGPLAEFPEAASLQPCIEQVSIPIHHACD
ncbi:hypothetical protein Tco_0997728, partial [Tanacetum coccineum]